MSIRQIALLLAATIGCSEPEPPARIVYPVPWLGQGPADVVRAALGDSFPSVEIPDSMLAALGTPQGAAADVDFALSTLSIPGITAAVGPGSSRATILVAPLYAQRGIPLISATATSLGDLSSTGWVFQLVPSDSVEGDFLVRYAADLLGARRLAVFYLFHDEYGVGLHRAIAVAAARSGVELLDQVPVTGDTHFEDAVARSIRRGVPDAIIVAARTAEAIAIARAAHARIAGVPILVGDGVNVDVMAEALGPVASDIYAPAWWHPDFTSPESRAFAALFEATTGSRPGPADAMYYDALMTAARAVRDGGRDPAAVRDYLSELGSTRPALRGATGEISFAPNRPANLVMTRLVSGRFEWVERRGHR